jgi:hypothetical protein
MADFNPKRDSSTRQLLAENCGQVENKTYSRNEIDRLAPLATEVRFFPGAHLLPDAEN